MRHIAEPQLSRNQKIVLKLFAKGKKNICEVGCWTGESTAILATEAKLTGGRITVIDWFNGNEGSDLKPLAEKHDIQKIFTDNMHEAGVLDVMDIISENSATAHEKLKDGAFDLIYIDAGHTYINVYEDIQNYVPKVRDGGIICGHDFDATEYNEKFINQDCVDGVHHGVIKAVLDTFKQFEVVSSIWMHTVRRGL